MPKKGRRTMLLETRIRRFDQFTRDLDQSFNKLAQNRRISRSALAHVFWYESFFRALENDPQWQSIAEASLEVIARFKNLAEAFNNGQSDAVTDHLAHQFAKAVDKNTEEVLKCLISKPV